ncbi:hypothetical protein ACS0Y6_22285 [Burkholderia gladioli]|uniref:hypothetical protein n=1 Tax=Burkholderia gladioli TaxID=28095 RepID=UPI003F791EF7
MKMAKSACIARSAAVVIFLATFACHQSDSAAADIITAIPETAADQNPSAAPQSPKQSETGSTLPAQQQRPGTGFSTDFGDSLRGQVHNQYNIRDDILKYIDDHYQDPAIRSNIIKYAAAQQDFIERGSTREAAIYYADRISRIISCLYHQIGLDGTQEAQAVLAMAVNTEARFKAYWEAVDLQSGRVSMQPQGDPCE